MAPSDRQPHSREDSTDSKSTAVPPKGILGEGPTNIAKKLTKLEKTQRTLRLLSSKIAQNSLINATKMDPTRFVLGVVSSMSDAQERTFKKSPITLIETKQPQYIELPKKDLRAQSPIMCSHFIFGDKPPETFARESTLSRFVHDYCLEFEPLDEAGKAFYLIPAEAGILSALAKPKALESAEEEDFLDLSKFVKYLPYTPKEARNILIEHQVHEGAPLDIDKIHDLLEEVTLVHFDGEYKKTNHPFSILKLEGGATFRMYPYGKRPPTSVPQGCEIISSNEVYYLIMPEIIARPLESQFMSQFLAP